MHLVQCLKKAERIPISEFTHSISRGLPSKFIGDASKRLGWASLIYAFTFTFAYYISNLREWIQTGTLAANLQSFNSIVGYLSIAMSLIMFGMSRSCRIDSKRVLDIGLIYLVLGSFGISMTQFWGVFPEWPAGFSSQRFHGIPWECAWILIYPVLAPNTHLKTFLGSVAAASTGPIALYLSMKFGATSPDAPDGFLVRYFLFTTYLCAAMALVTCRVIHGFGKHLRKAEEVGGYRMETLLGEGGMGEVWKARHYMLARPAAVKLIRPEVLGIDEAKREQAVRRFEREAQTTALLKSPHTIGLYDFGVSDEGMFYYVMELLEGLNLDVFVKRFGPMEANRAVFVLRQVCHSLKEAHASQLIHRDIKPANVYLCRMGLECDFVKVLDFGLVKSKQEEHEDITQITIQGMAPGTPGFMAPEMAMSRDDIDGRTDIYSLGCVGYWLLTGQLVFEGDTPLATVVHHIQTVPIPPSGKTELTIPETLEKIVLSCLEKNPKDRPQSAEELDRLLQECLKENPWDNERAVQWWDLHLPPQV
ncbi:MAG: serine/threonine-protein kinase [Acidobacteriota bacterium]